MTSFQPRPMKVGQERHIIGMFTHILTGKIWFERTLAVTPEQATHILKMGKAITMKQTEGKPGSVYYP